MWRSARPRRSAWSVMPRRPSSRGLPVPTGAGEAAGAECRPGRRGWIGRPSPGSRRLEVGPDREEDRPPLVGCVRDELLEGGGQVVHRRHHSLAPRAVDRHVDREDPAAVPATARAAHGHRIGRHPALDGQHRRTHRQRRGVAEQRDRRSAAGQVAVADEPDRDAVAERLEERPARLAEADQANAVPAAGAFVVGLHARVVERLHGRHGLADAEGEEQDGELDRPEVEADEEDRLARHDRLGDDLRACRARGARHVLAGDGRVARHLEVVAGGMAEGRVHEPFEGLRVGGGGANGGRPATRLAPARRTPGAGCAAPGRRGPERRDTTGRRRARRRGRRAAPAAGRPATRRRRAGGRGSSRCGLGRLGGGLGGVGAAAVAPRSAAASSASSGGSPRPGPGRAGRPA